MKLSVCIFTYNHANFISETLDSVLMQETNFDFEIVVGDDHSIDGAKEIILKYQEKYPGRIRAIFNPENKGMMGNNIDSILQCKGDYIALLDGDDYWVNPKKLQMQADFLDAHRQYQFCFHDGKIKNPDGRMADATCCGDIKRNSIKFIDVISKVSIPTFSIVFRRSAIAGYPPPWFKTLNAPDRPLFLLLCAVGPGYFFPECWGVYRKHMNGSWTGQHYQSRWLTHLQIYRIINRHFNYRYHTHFMRNESRVCYILALDLIKDNKVKRAICYFRKYLRIGNSFFLINPAVFFKSTIFAWYYIRHSVLVSTGRLKVTEAVS